MSAIPFHVEVSKDDIEKALDFVRGGATPRESVEQWLVDLLKRSEPNNEVLHAMEDNKNE